MPPEPVLTFFFFFFISPVFCGMRSVEGGLKNGKGACILMKGRFHCRMFGMGVARLVFLGGIRI